MSDPTAQEWPNQRLKILVPGMILVIISTFFVAWRVVYGIGAGRNFMICDYLLIIATVCPRNPEIGMRLTVSQASQHIGDRHVVGSGRRWARTTYHGPLDRHHAICLPAIHLTDSQHYRCRRFKVVDLRVASDTQLLQGVPRRRLAVYSYGHGFQLPSARPDVVRL